MADQHRPENLWTVALLDVQPFDRVLEIGFGPGLAIEEVARRANRGLVAGIDFSKTMVNAAKKRNADGIRAGRVDLRIGDAAHTPFADRTFDKAFSIHSIYFWPNPLVALNEIKRVLKPEGLLILTVLPKEKWSPDGSKVVGTPQCKPYSGDELIGLLGKVGFTDVKIESDPSRESPSNYSVLGRKRRLTP